MQLHCLDPHARAVVGTIYEWKFWKIRAISFLGTTGDIIAGEHVDVSSGDYMRFRFWEQRRILV